MSATRILWGQFLLVLGIALAFVWGATQWTAWRLGHQGELGVSWMTIGHWPIYAPHKFFLWWYWFDAYAPGVFNTGALIAASGGFCEPSIAICASRCATGGARS